MKTRVHFFVISGSMKTCSVYAQQKITEEQWFAPPNIYAIYATTKWRCRARESDVGRSCQDYVALAQKFWAEVVMTVAWVINRTGPSPEPGISPYEPWYKKKSAISHLKVFGT